MDDRSFERRLGAVLVAVLVTVLLPTALCAQETVQGWPGLTATSRLPTVYVLDETGTETSGRLLRLNPDSLVVVVGGAERRFDATRVRRIQMRGDSLRNGAIIGAVVGAVVGLLTAGISDCSGEDPGGPCPGGRAAIFLVSTGVYASIGAGIDAIIVGRTTLYEAPRVTPSAALTLRVGW